MALVLAAAGVFGCAQNAPPRQYYILEAQRRPHSGPPDQGGPAPGGAESGGPGAPAAGVLEVRRFRVDAAFTGRQLVYRVDAFRYESDYYHQFLVLPGIMIAEKTRDWLGASGLFQQAVAPGSAVTPTYALTGNIMALYGDFAAPAAPTAVLEIHFSLLGPAKAPAAPPATVEPGAARPPQATEAPLFSQTYRTVSPVASRTADAVVAALNQDLVEILTRLEADLRRHLARAPQ